MAEIKFTPLSEEDLEAFAPTAEKISQSIYENSQKALLKRVNIAGPLASRGEQNNGHYLNEGSHYLFQNISIHESIICNGLINSRLDISSKINHLLIRGCQNTSFYINQGLISGLTIIGGSNNNIVLPFQNTTSLEQTHNINIEGILLPESLILIASCSDIIINTYRLPINIFDRGLIVNGSFLNLPFVAPELTIKN